MTVIKAVENDDYGIFDRELLREIPILVLLNKKFGEGFPRYFDHD